MRNFPKRDKVESAALKALETVKAKGLAGADVYYTAGVGNEWGLRNGEPEIDRSGASWRMGIRVLGPSGKQGVADTSDLSKEAVVSMAEWAVANCLASGEDEDKEEVPLYSGPVSFVDLGLYDPVVRDIKPGQRRQICEEMMEVASKDRRVRSVRTARWSDGWGEIFYMSTRGLSLWHSETGVSCGVVVVMEEDGAYDMGGFGLEGCHADELDHRAIAQEAVERVGISLGGKALPTGRYTVVLDPEVAATLFEVTGELFLSQNIHKNLSMLKDKMGEKIASEAVTLIDDGTLSGKPGSTPFDGEGVPTTRTVLLSGGKVQSFLNDLKYAKKDGVTPTGNAVRSPGSIPEAGLSNLYLEGGSGSARSFLETPQKRLFITDLMGVHTIDPVSGDYSLGAKGAMYKSGELVQPVSGVTVAGNLLELLMKIVAVGDDLRFFGDMGGCSVVIEDVPVAGS
ncbi:MAG: PmbA protein [Synergistales bacterium]|nr:PmbA protein [Synergistales bacterium]